jgi:uncharacterized protein (DUF1015 family)
VGFQVAPFRPLRFQGRDGAAPPDLSALVAPPYDVISPDEHRKLLERSPHNIVRLTLGDRPGERAPYQERSALLSAWREEHILREAPQAALYVYGVDYAVPGSPGERRSFRGLLALGGLHDFEEKVVLPHERTFPDVVDDRYRLLEATRTQLEPILLLYSDPRLEIDGLLAEASRGPAEPQVEARPGETHSLWAIRETATARRLQALFAPQRPIIADGHHRYTTACLYRKNHRGDPRLSPGSGWQPMVLGNLFGEGLSILATHRLVRLGGREEEVLRILSARLEPAPAGEPADFVVETKKETRRFRVPVPLRSRLRGVAATDYAILHQVVLKEWLAPLCGEEEPEVRYFKEGTGEGEALRRGEGDLLFRMNPVKRGEFQKVVEGGEVFPHKTTFFYPKLWSGLSLWHLTEPEQGRGA